MHDTNDRSAIQSSIGEVLQRIASNEIDPRRAGLLLYGLQIASLNLGKSQPATKTSTERESETIEEITIDPTLGVLAPRTELSTTTTRKSVVAQLIAKMIRSNQEEVASADTNVLPALQATEDTAALDSISIVSFDFARGPGHCRLCVRSPRVIRYPGFSVEDKRRGAVVAGLLPESHQRSVTKPSIWSRAWRAFRPGSAVVGEPVAVNLADHSSAWGLP